MENKVVLESVERSDQHSNALTPELADEDRKKERKLKFKLDFIILPLLATVYFLASMVSPGCIGISPFQHLLMAVRVEQTWAMRKSQAWTPN